MQGADDMRFLGTFETTVAPQAVLDIHAIAKSRVRGRISTPTGMPTPRVRVTLQERSERRTPAWADFAYAETMADGTFMFDGLHSTEKDVRVSVVGPSGAGISAVVHLAAGADVNGADVVITPPGAVEGIVRDSAGAPVIGARVWLQNVNADGTQRDGSLAEVLTQRGGNYRFKGVDPGWHRVTFGLDRRRPRSTTTSPQAFEVTSGSTVKVDLVKP